MNKILGTLVLMCAVVVGLTTVTSATADPIPPGPAGPQYAVYELPDKAAPPCITTTFPGQQICVQDAKGGSAAIILRTGDTQVFDWISDKRAERMIRQWRRENCAKKKDPCNKYDPSTAH